MRQRLPNRLAPRARREDATLPTHLRARRARQGRVRPQKNQELHTKTPPTKTKKMTTDEKLDNEMMFTRNVLCGMIRQAVIDAKNDREYLSRDNKNGRESNQRSAMQFLNSEFYRHLCEALGRASGIGLPHDRIRLEAMK